MARRKDDTINIDSEAFELLSRQVKAKEEDNRINQQTLTALKIRERITNDILERYANLGEQARAIPGILEAIELRLASIEASTLKMTGDDTKLATELRAYAAILNELAEAISDRFDRFEIEMSRRVGRLEDIETARLTSDTIRPDAAADWIEGFALDRKRRELRQHYFNLNEFREQAAKYGINPPINLVNEIAYAEQRVAELEAELHASSK